MSRPAPRRIDVVQATHLRFDPGPPVSRLRGRITTSFVEALWSPALVASSENRRPKPPSMNSVGYRAESARGPFSLRRSLKSF